MYKNLIKPILDFILAFLLIIIFLPIILIVALLIKLKLGSPILFTQERPGLNGKIFRIYKFRTMSDESYWRQSAIDRRSKGRRGLEGDYEEDGRDHGWL